jgi:hypothetical protein
LRLASNGSPQAAQVLGEARTSGGSVGDNGMFGRLEPRMAEMLAWIAPSITWPIS